MAQEAPVTLEQVANLSALGVNLDHVKFGTTTMESDKFVCVCERQVDGQGNLVIVDLLAGNSVQRRPINAEAAIINPVSNAIALRSGNQLQIFNMELRNKIKSHQMNEAVVFWRWISVNTIALVTASAVFHWNIEDESPPTRVFYRSARLGAETQIVSYEASVDTQWLLLVGISQGKRGRVTGDMQLYSTEKKVSQVLHGHAGAFLQMKPPGRTVDAQVLVFAGADGDGLPMQLLVMELGGDRHAGGSAFHLPPQPIPLAAEDFPELVFVSPGDDIAYMVTKMGFLLVFDVHSGKLVYRAQVLQDTPFVTCLESKSNGMLGITRRGQLLHFAINREKLVSYVLSTLGDLLLALSLGTRMNLPGAEELYVTEFNRLLSVNDTPGAARLAAVSPHGALRTPETIERFQQTSAPLDQVQPIMQYFSILLEKGKLNKVESVELVRLVLLQGRGNMLKKWLLEDKLESSEELGDVVAPFDAMLALSVYLQAEVPEKVTNCFMQSVVKEGKLQDPLPLIHLCDRYNCVEELTRYLHSNKLMKYVDVYVTKVSPEKAPAVIGTLLDLECEDEYIKNLLKQMPKCPVGELCEQVEKRCRLPLLQSWLETRIEEGNKETAAHNAIGKIYASLNKEPQQFLTTNLFYDSMIVGKFCEEIDPYLAFLAYRRAGSACDADLIRVATENGLFKDLARYLVERQDLDLWGKVLMKQEESEEGFSSRRAVIDQVVQTAIPESTKPEEVSTTIHAFMNAELSTELVEQRVSCVGMNRCFAFF